MATAERKGRQFQCWLRPHVPARIHWRLHLAQGRMPAAPVWIGSSCTSHNPPRLVVPLRRQNAPQCGLGPLVQTRIHRGLDQLYKRIHRSLSQRRHPTAPVSVGWVHLYRPESTIACFCVPAGSSSRDINQSSMPAIFTLFSCLFLSLWPFQVYFIP